MADTAEYFDRLDRWQGPGNTEFRINLARAYTERSVVRLEGVSTHGIEHVQSGKDASKVQESFDRRMDLMGALVVLDGEKLQVSLSASLSSRMRHRNQRRDPGSLLAACDPPIGSENRSRTRVC
jgi:hypothetical protein